jgi:hypothetical protein
MLLPFGTLQATAALVAATLGPAAPRCFPDPQLMPSIFRSPGTLAYQPGGAFVEGKGYICHACQLLRNVELEGSGKVSGPAPCSGLCDARGLRCLDKTRHSRLTQAVQHCRFTAKELAFVRWPGVLPYSTCALLVDLAAPGAGADRDSMLQALMSPVDVGLPDTVFQQLARLHAVPRLDRLQQLMRAVEAGLLPSETPRMLGMSPVNRISPINQLGGQQQQPAASSSI